MLNEEMAKAAPNMKKVELLTNELATAHDDLYRKNCQKVTVVRTPEQKFERKEVLPSWPRAKKMASQPCLDL